MLFSSMFGWLIIIVIVFGLGCFVYCYYKFLNYFIWFKFESEDLYEDEFGLLRLRWFCVYVWDCVDSDEEDCCLFCDEINDVDMKIYWS